MPRRKTSVGFIGYVRVSTERMMDDGEGLRAQTLKLEEYARGLDLEIEIVPASEPGHGPITARPRYLEAIQEAEQLGWKLSAMQLMSATVVEAKTFNNHFGLKWC